MRALAALLMAALVPAVAPAQVGHTPEDSPFRDVPESQTLTPFAGWLNAGEDPAGVAPQAAPLIGVRYDVLLGGPASFAVRVAGAFSERTVLDPSKTGDARVVGTESNPLYLADVGIGVQLTGQKSWHRLIPTLHGGLGVATDFNGADVGRYKFGTTFAISLGAGIRYVHDRLQLRADFSDYLYQIKYPDTYYVQPPGGSPVLSRTQSTSLWTHNIALTLGATYSLFR